jgi:SagB-type dehydrogenase family enzyme
MAVVKLGTGLIYGALDMGFKIICVRPVPNFNRGDTMEYIELPKPDTVGKMPLETCITRRRSVRRYINQPLDEAAIGQLAWSGQGITDPVPGRRTAPSAGAMFPTELYLATQAGVYRYLPVPHALERISEGDIRSALAKACLGQGFVRQAPLSIVIGMNFPHTTGHYGERGKRYVILEAGHIAQNLHLQAIALGLDSVPVGAYNDSAVAQAVGLPDGIEPVYIVCIGKAQK